MEPKISFITAVRDRSEAFKEMLSSLVNQDMPEWEALIVDDHSVEDVKKIVKDFNDDRMKYFRQEEGKRGISHARNLAVSQAKTDILLTADGDDISRPQRARVTYEIMTKNSCDAFYSNLEYFIAEEDRRWTPVFQPFNAELFKMFNFMTNPGTAYRKDVFIKAGGYDPEFVLSEDYDLWLRILNNGGKFCYTREILVDYRRSPGSVSLGKPDELHQFIMKTRIKNRIPPFDISDVKQFAEPTIADYILSNGGRRVWKDDRYEVKDV